MRWVVLVLVLACAPTAPEGAESFTPPPGYGAWWASVASCSGLTPIAHGWQLVHWFTVPSGSDGKMWCGNMRTRGCWRAPDDIYVAKGQETVATVVSHEMLHEMLNGDADHSHGAWAQCFPTSP